MNSAVTVKHIDDVIINVSFDEVLQRYNFKLAARLIIEIRLIIVTIVWLLKRENVKILNHNPGT